MFERYKIAVDISSDRISIVVGTKTKIKNAHIIETPQNAYKEDKIENIDSLAKVIKDYLVNERIKVNDISFIVKGQDVITRHTVLPLLGEEGMREAVSWELKQFLNDRLEEYYYDYEILKESGEDKTKNAYVIIAAVEVNKISAYLELAEKLKLNLVSIDSYATVGARMLNNLKIFKNREDIVGLITLNIDTSSFHIADYNKLEIEKYQNLGILGDNHQEINTIEEYNNYLYKIDLNIKEEMNEETLNVDGIINTISSYFNSIIQFYFVGKVKKTLDKIYLIGSGSNIKGIDKKLSQIFNTEVIKIDDFKTLKYSIKVPRNIKISDYFYSYGLLLNNNVKRLNLIPHDLKIENMKGKKKFSYVLGGALVLLILFGGIGYLKGKEVYLNSQKTKLINKINNNQANVDKLNTLENDIALYNMHIEKVELLNGQKDKKTDDLIFDIQRLIPGEVVINSFTINNGKSISMGGSSSSYERISEFWANLREDDRFRDSHITDITNEESGSNFTLEILIQGGQS